MSKDSCEYHQVTSDVFLHLHKQTVQFRKHYPKRQGDCLENSRFTQRYVKLRKRYANIVHAANSKKVFEKCGNPCNKRNKNLRILIKMVIGPRDREKLFPIPRANNHFDQDPSVIIPYITTNCNGKCREKSHLQYLRLI